MRESLGISPDQLMILTVGGDAASKGAQEVMQEMGQDWQTWSAALYLYAAQCVELKSTPFFDAMREK